jgi:hypothetical protein
VDAGEVRSQKGKPNNPTLAKTALGWGHPQSRYHSMSRSLGHPPGLSAFNYSSVKKITGLKYVLFWNVYIIAFSKSPIKSFQNKTLPSLLLLLDRYHFGAMLSFKINQQ